MAEWVAIQKTTHQNARWENHTHYNFAKTNAVAPILLAELAQLLPYYPLAFVKTQATETQAESFQLVALLSLQPNVNYYLNPEGKWRVPYVPSTFRSHPFKLIAKSAEEFVLCLDQTSEFFSLNGEASYSQPLFSVNNEQVALAEPTAQVLNFLQQCQANETLTQQAVNALAEYNLIVPWNIERAAPETQAPPVAVKGVYQIDPAALAQLSGEALAQLNQHKALEIAYAQLFSKPRLQAFVDLSNLHQQQQTAQNLDLDQIFGEEADDMFKF